MQDTREWSGSPDPSDPDNFWIDDATGERIAARPTLDDLLEKWAVFPDGAWENDEGPKGFHAVANDEGIVAYFAKIEAAFRFRLAEINRELNG